MSPCARNVPDAALLRLLPRPPVPLLLLVFNAGDLLGDLFPLLSRSRNLLMRRKRWRSS